MNEEAIVQSTGWRKIWRTANRRKKSIFAGHILFALTVATVMLCVLLCYERDGWQNEAAHVIYLFATGTGFMTLLYTLRGGWRSLLANVMLLLAIGVSILLLNPIISSLIEGETWTTGKYIIGGVFLTVALSFDLYTLHVLRRLSLPSTTSIASTWKKKRMANVPEKYRYIDFSSFINDPLVAAFVGKNFEHYKQIWTKDFKETGDIRKASSKFHLNLLALLTTCPTWLGYRKMYSIAFSYIGVLCAASISIDLAGWKNEPSTYLGANLVTALLCKGFYLSHTWNFFYKHREMPRDELAVLVAQKGGTSVWISIAVTLVTFVAIGTISVLGENLRR